MLFTLNYHTSFKQIPLSVTLSRHTIMILSHYIRLFPASSCQRLIPNGTSVWYKLLSPCAYIKTLWFTTHVIRSRLLAVAYYMSIARPWLSNKWLLKVFFNTIKYPGWMVCLNYHQPQLALIMGPCAKVRVIPNKLLKQSARIWEKYQ